MFSGKRERYEEDIETWNQVKDGEEYSVEELLNTLNCTERAQIFLSPATTELYDISTTLPEYDHNAEEIRIEEEDVDTLLGYLDRRTPTPGVTGAAKFMIETRVFDHTILSKSSEILQQHNQYTVTTRYGTNNA